MRKREARLRVCAALVCGALFSSPVARAAPFASEVVSYVAGSNVTAGYDDPLVALGSPERSTGSGSFDGDVTVFNTPYRSEHVVSIGAGGSLVLRFDEQVQDDAANPYGIDLLVYGNAFLGLDFDTGLADGTLFSEPARIALSQDGQSWFDVGGAFADDLFPTLAYRDPPGPFESGGTLPTSFTQPVDPALTPADFIDLDVAAIAALYGGGAGGAAVDLASVGLPWIQYVRIWQPEGDPWSAEVDAIADVPGPSALALLGIAGLVLFQVSSRVNPFTARRRPLEFTGHDAGMNRVGTQEDAMNGSAIQPRTPTSQRIETMMRISFSLSLRVLSLMSALAAGMANGQLPPAEFAEFAANIGCNLGSDPGDGVQIAPGSAAGGGNAIGYDGSVASWDGHAETFAAGPAVKTQVSATNLSACGYPYGTVANADGRIRYWVRAVPLFEVDPFGPGIRIPLRIAALGEVRHAEDAGVRGTVEFGATPQFSTPGGRAVLTSPGYLTQTITVYPAAGEAILIWLTAGCGGTDGACQAWIDRPTFEIDPTFTVEINGVPVPGADLFAIEMSPNLPEDNCPYHITDDVGDADGDGRGNECECSDQNGDGLNDVSDLIAINMAIFNPTLATPLCDGNNDGRCSVSDILSANVEIFSPGNTSICGRQPVPGP